MSSGSGQLRPAARKRLSVARTVEGATPTRRAISWFDKSPTNFNRRTSRTWRIVVLSAGIRYLPWTAKGADLSRPAEAPTTRAKSSRNGGRDHLGMVGGIISEWRATSFRNHGRHRPESAGWWSDPAVVVMTPRPGRSIPTYVGIPFELMFGSSEPASG